jgi:hypothetical protein
VLARLEFPLAGLARRFHPSHLSAITSQALKLLLILKLISIPITRLPLDSFILTSGGQHERVFCCENKNKVEKIFIYLIFALSLPFFLCSLKPLPSPSPPLPPTTTTSMTLPSFYPE